MSDSTVVRMADERPVSSPALRYHGAKFRLAGWLMQFFPQHQTYVEPFGGAAGVLLQKPRSYAEVYNDMDGDVVNFFRVLREPSQREALIQACVLTPYARAEFEAAWDSVEEPIERARRLAIRAQMGFGSAGATKGATGFRIDSKREYGTAQHHWTVYPAAIATAGHRLAGVLIENRPAIAVMEQHDGRDTLHFVDPPYVHGTRVNVMKAGKSGYYRHEMTDEQHIELLQALDRLEGMVVLTSYAHEIYESRLQGWIKHTTNSRISLGRGGGTRIECAWLNPLCAERQNQTRLLA